MSLPSREDINVHDNLDERSACQHFLGKNLRDAEDLIRQNAFYYQEDLLFMGVTAFRFYVPALINYIQSDAAEGDSDIVNCFAMILEFRLERESNDLRPIATTLAEACRYLLDNYDRFEVSEEIYGDLKSRFIELQRNLMVLNA